MRLACSRYYGPFSFVIARNRDTSFTTHVCAEKTDLMWAGTDYTVATRKLPAPLRPDSGAWIEQCDS